MDLSFQEMVVIAIAIVLLFGPDKLPKIARDLGSGVRKMRGAMDDIKTEIMKDTDNPLSEIKQEIDKVKDAAKDYNPQEYLKRELDVNPAQDAKPKVDQLSDSHEGPVCR